MSSTRPAPRSLYVAYDVPLRLAWILRRAARRGTMRHRPRLVPGCALLSLRPRRGHSATSWRAADVLPWRFPPPPLSQERGPVRVSERISERLIVQPGLALAFLLDWSRVTRSAVRRSRRQLLNAPPVPSQMVRRTPVGAPKRESGEAARLSSIRRDVIAHRVELKTKSVPPIPTPSQRAPRPVVARGEMSAAAVSGVLALASPALQLVGYEPSRLLDAGVAAAARSAPARPVARPPLESRAHRASRGETPQAMMWRPRPTTIATVRSSIEQLVAVEVKRRLAASTETSAPAAPSSHASQPAAPAGQAAANPVITDGLVVQLLTRLRALAREERFRAGHLR